MLRLLLAIALVLMPTQAMAAPAPPSFSIGDTSANEEDGRICWPIRKHGRLNNLPSTVSFYIVAGTAKPGVHYTDVKLTFVFQPSETIKQACTAIVNDAIPGPAKTLTGRLAAISKANQTKQNARVYDGTGAGVINDTDTAPPPIPDPVKCPDGTEVPAGQTCPTPPPAPTVVYPTKLLVGDVVGQCPSGAIQYLTQPCAALVPPTPIPTPTPPMEWKLIALRGGNAYYARAKITCPSIYSTAETARVGIKYPGVVAGQIYRLILGGPSSMVRTPPLGSWGAAANGASLWTLENPTGGQAISVAETCLEGVMPL
jgi:hypothetical protein